MEIESLYDNKQAISLRSSQPMYSQNHSRNDAIQDINSSIANLISMLESNYNSQRSISPSNRCNETQAQAMVRILKEQFENASRLGSIKLNFYQLEVQPALMERAILSINQISHLNRVQLNLSRQNWGEQQMQLFCNQLQYCRGLRDLDINFSLNYIGDKGHQILSQTLCSLETLEKIKINFERNGLQTRSVSILEIFNMLKKVEEFSLNLNGNNIEIETEVRSLLPKFQSDSIFATVKSFEILFDECQNKNSSCNMNENGKQDNRGVNHQYELSNTNNCVANNEQSQNNQSNHMNNRPLNQQNTIQNKPNNAQQQQQLQLIQQNIVQQQQQIQQLTQYAQQMQSHGYPSNHPQFLQVVAQIQQLQLYIQQNVQLSKTLMSQQNTTPKKKSVIYRLLEIMLKFTHNLESFSFSCPGQLIDSASWEYFAEMLKIKAGKLQKFRFSASNSVTQNQQDMEYFFYQMAKLKNLREFSLSLHNLNSQNSLFLEKFLKPLNKLEIVNIDLSSPDSFSNQGEIYRDLCNFIKATESTNIREFNLNLSNSQIDNESALNLFQGIAKMRNLQVLKLNLSSCSTINDKSIQLLCEALIHQNNIKNLTIDISNSNFSPVSIQFIMQTLVLLKNNLTSLQLNLTKRGEIFNNFDNNIINNTVNQLSYLKKCIISSNKNSKIRLYREKACQADRMIKLCQLVKNNSLLQTLRKEIAFEALQFLI